MERPVTGDTTTRNASPLGTITVSVWSEHTTDRLPSSITHTGSGCDHYFQLQELMYSKRYIGYPNSYILPTTYLPSNNVLSLLASPIIIINCYLHPIYLNFTSHCVMSISILLENYGLFKVVFIYSSNVWYSNIYIVFIPI